MFWSSKGMVKKEKLAKVQFWIGKDLKKEIDDFAHNLTLAAADFYKGGAVLLKKLFINPAEININLFTRSFKDVEKSIINKQILKEIKSGRSSN